MDGVEHAKQTGSDKVEIQIRKNCLDSVNEILQKAMGQGYGIVSFARTELGLEEAIMKMLGDGEK